MQIEDFDNIDNIENEIIVDCITNFEGIRPSEIAAETGFTRDFVKYRISCLERAGYVITQKQGNGRYCFLSPKLGGPDNYEKQQQIKKPGIFRRLFGWIICREVINQGTQ